MAGKSSKLAKAKNTKKAADPDKSKKDKASFCIPNNNPLLTGDSDDDSIGQELPHLLKNPAKFLYEFNPSVESMLKTKELLAPEFHDLCNLSNPILYSSTKQTWAKNCSPWKLFTEFCTDYNIKFVLPIKKEYIRAFVTWAATKKNLRSSTIRTYISSLNVAHALSNIEGVNLSSDICTKLALKGVKNYSDPALTQRAVRLPISFDLLRVLGHRINCLNWGELAKQVFWSACTTSFFLSCRMGKILSPFQGNFEPRSTLKWENVVFSENKEVLLFVPYSKTNGFEGKIIDLYPIKGSKFCPASSLIRLKKLAMAEGLWKPENPVFAFKSGKFLTKQKINSWLGSILSDFADEFHVITGHSFRAAIPSILSSQPKNSSFKANQEWGG